MLAPNHTNMISSRQREKYRMIRYDYYHAGRLLHLMGNFHSACIMLGYTVETTMKEDLMFPNLKGSPFVEFLRINGSWQAVNLAYHSP